MIHAAPHSDKQHSSEQPKEPMYLISESELQSALIAIAEDDEDKNALTWFNHIRSRPHPAPEISHTQCYKTGYADGARQAREDFADKVIAFCKSNDCVQSTYGNCDCVSTTDTECVICFVESLRSTH